MQNFNASIRVKANSRIRSLLRAVFLQSIACFTVAPMLHGHPGHAASPAPAKPVAPSALALRLAGDTRFDLAWSDNSNNEEGFQIERRLSTSTVYTLVETIGPNFEVYSDITVARDAKYFYRVRAFNNEGFSSYTNIVNGMTPPIAPGSLAAKPVSTKRIDLTWIDKSNTEESIEIERGLPSSPQTYARIATLGPNATAFSDTGLTQNTKYFYRLRASNSGGQSEYSAAVNATTLPIPPNEPSRLAATTISSSQIALVWRDNSDNEDGFAIERKIGETGVYIQVALVGAEVRSFTSATLNPNTKYYYRVRAYNRGGESAFTKEVSATTLPLRPNAPSLLAATTVSNTRIDLAWQDNAANEDSFKIERRNGTTGTFALIATVGANANKYSDLGLVSNTVYSYRVYAINLGGFSN